MEAKKVVNSKFVPLAFVALFLLFPTLKAIFAIIALSLSRPQLQSFDRSAPRELQRFFYNFGVTVELSSIKGIGANQYLEIEVPLALNVPFTGHWQTTTTMRVKQATLVQGLESR
jgi:hypothetical protein